MSLIIRRLIDEGWDAPVFLRQDGVYCHPQGSCGDVSYPESFYENPEGQDQGFWSRHRSREILRLLTKYNVNSMVEVGAGTGSVSRSLEKAGLEVLAIEPLERGAQTIAAGGTAVILGFVEDLHLPAEKVEHIGIFDVIEHLEDAERLLCEIQRVLTPDGVCSVTVPAGRWLWGQVDVDLGHKRRYSKRELHRLFSSAGFEKIESRFMFAGLVPPALILRAIPFQFQRFIGRRQDDMALANAREQLSPSSLIDRVVWAYLTLEFWLSSFIPLPYGLSIIALYRKKSPASGA